MTFALNGQQFWHLSPIVCKSIRISFAWSPIIKLKGKCEEYFREYLDSFSSFRYFFMHEIGEKVSFWGERLFGVGTANETKNGQLLHRPLRRLHFLAFHFPRLFHAKRKECLPTFLTETFHEYPSFSFPQQNGKRVCAKFLKSNDSVSHKVLIGAFNPERGLQSSL